LKVLSGAEKKPDGIIEIINSALITKNESNVKELYAAIKNFYSWPSFEYGWAAKFIIDSEINWMNGAVPIADL
jgi:hypothetical protein